MRGLGRVFKRPASNFYWIAYSHRGKEIRESSGSPKESDARRLLKRRLAETQSGKFVGPSEERVTFGDLVALYEQDYDVRGLRSRWTADARVKHLRAFFGLDKVLSITPARLRAYQAARLAEDAETSTVNREVAALHRMFQLARKQGLVSTVPVFPGRLEEPPARQGFFEHAEYEAIRKHLPSDYQDVLDFGYYTGWRRREVTELTWAEVDLVGGVVRLDPERSKSKSARLLPLSLPLREVIERRVALRLLESPLVFHKDGVPVGDWRKTWNRACRLAGFPEKRFHDLRRTVARNLVRSGVPERVAMALLGHKTRSVFDRYNIVSEADLKQAAGRLAYYVSAQSPLVPVAAR